ncbi:hypothetical protein D3C87_2032030 [compost metagenome]
MTRIHQRIAVAETVDFSLQGRGSILEHLNVGMNFIATFNAELAADRGVAEIALKSQERYR